jgi:transcriptional regulator with XRE-family HTH domain
LSQRELGKLIGKARNQVSAWERGSQLPSVRTLLRLAKVLNTLAEALYEGMYCELPRRQETPS